MPITTAEELLHAQDIGRCELVRGKLLMLAYRGGEEGAIVAEIAYRLRVFAEGKGLGTVLPAVGFVLARAPDTVRAPAVAFLRAGRGGAAGYVEGVPDLAVEVNSPFDPPGHVAEKVAEWLEAGAGAVWVVDPPSRTIIVHEHEREPCVLQEADVLSGGDVLPGFELPVREIFA